MKRIWVGLGMSIALASMTAGGIVISQGGGGAPEGTANIWIENGGGACAGGRSATPLAYADSVSPDRICGTFDAAWDAMNAGDTARVVAGSFGQQTIDGDKASETFIIAADGTEIAGSGDAFCGTAFGSSLLCAKGNNMTLENLTVDFTPANGCTACGSEIIGDNITYRNVNLYGPVVALYCDGASDFTWTADTGTFSRLGEDGTEGNERVVPGDQEPVWLDSCTNTLIQRLKINPQDAENASDFHLENIRVQGSSDVTIDQVWFVDSTGVPGNGVGSGNIFVSGTPVNNLHVYNTFFGDMTGTGDFQVSATTTTCTGWVLAYNTFSTSTIMNANNCGSNGTWTGNLGPANAGSCGTKNVWQHASNPGCGGDTWVSGATDGIGNLGFNSVGVLQAGSPAINAAETPGPSDFCTDPAIIASVDGLGTVRPQSTICDAGWNERP